MGAVTGDTAKQTEGNCSTQLARAAINVISGTAQQKAGQQQQKVNQIS